MIFSLHILLALLAPPKPGPSSDHFTIACAGEKNFVLDFDARKTAPDEFLFYGMSVVRMRTDLVSKDFRCEVGGQPTRVMLCLRDSDICVGQEIGQ